MTSSPCCCFLGTALQGKEKEKEKAERLAKAKARQEEGEVVDEDMDEDQAQDNKVLEVSSEGVLKEGGGRGRSGGGCEL